MNIQLVSVDSVRQKGFQTDKIVSVHVLERKGNTAVIDVNGLRMEAVIEADVPDNFLAYVEMDVKGKSFRLRILSSMKDGSSSEGTVKMKLMEELKSFLLSQNLPLTESYFQSAVALHSAGIKLDKEILRLMNLAFAKYGSEAGKMMLLFLKKGLAIDPEFVEFFVNIRSVLRKLLENSKTKIEKNQDFQKISEGEIPSEVKYLSDLFTQYFGGMNYLVSLLNYQNDEVLVQQRTSNRNGVKRYYFDCSGGKIGHFTITADVSEGALSVNVILESDFYQEHQKAIDQGREKLMENFRSMVPDKRISLAFSEEREDNFWMDGQLPKDWQESGAIFNLDISV